MEHLPQTKGKGVLMFAKRRQRMDEISAEHEEMRRKGIPVDAIEETKREIVMPPPQESKQSPQDLYARQEKHYQGQPFQLQMLQQSANSMNGLDPHQGSAVPKPLVSNRTAKPFFSGHNQGQKTFSPVRGVSSPTSKKPENIFKVPIPVNTTPHVWSPTSDVIASRDERIAIPAIKTGILPETKRRGANKTDLKERPLHQKKRDEKSLTEFVQEEDLLSLGAEACNFMQAPTVKQKNPPPVLPKPVINPAHPLWSADGHAVSTSLLMTSSSAQAMGHNQVQAGHTKQHPAAAWTPEPHQTPHKLRAGPSKSKTPWIKSQSEENSVASCPPQHLSTYLPASKAPSASHQEYSSETGASEGLNLKGKGAELFARRQTRMEKFIVDNETVRTNKVRPSSPTLSMPSTWKYSSNIRAPPPVSYNPILSPFYPLAAVKQPPPATSPKTKPKVNKEKKNPPPKHLNVLDVMKHQPYQLDSSLFTYNFTPEVEEAVSPKDSKPTSANSSSKISQTDKQNPSKATGEGFSRCRSLSSPMTHNLLSRQFSWVEQPKTPLSSMEALASVPLNESKMSATHRKSLPETPAEWKERVFYESLGGPQEMPPVVAVTSCINSFFSVPKDPVVHGTTFCPSQPLVTSKRYSRGSSLPNSYTLQKNHPQSHRVSWKL